MKLLIMALTSALLSCAASLPPAGAFPPWSQGRNNPAPDQGYVFQVPDIDNVPDLHGNPSDAKLVLFIGGNQFMVLPELVVRFEAVHPDLRGHIFYETLPPGILRKQLSNHGTLTLGNLTLNVRADVYEAGLRVLEGMVMDNEVERAVPYATNQLTIMVRAGNPLGIHSLKDLGGAQVRLSMPNPEWEGVARQIASSLEKSGGAKLVKTVMEDKVANGTTLLTQVHHRQTPMRILSGEADAGVVWASEALFQIKVGNPIASVDIPGDQNTTATYAAGVLKNAPHPEAARAWVAFLGSQSAQDAYRESGFGSTSSDRK